ncbi:NAD(P)-dependent oxidoreductase [Prauserella cavernicola]|uniref:NAD(P)-dependent oxidoreductase n=1 Tax=Prauserella cavernicola TaxID=2800127 RepID=A0A934V312_9PSEU|nr:NAD(P)-binding domain-containing protein [Prauserella cavernicola]MBK1783084.1 NAD(P)-dependent oxidoreductase [Prauserella cavernicola]
MTASHDDRPPVTVLGLGAMGTALARALLGAGHPVTAWNRTAAKAEPLVELGAARAATPGEAIAAGRLVFACLLDYASVHDVLDDHADALRGRVLVNLTNGTPVQARTFSEWAACHGADYLGGGIMAVPPQIGTPDAFVLYSGSRSAFETSRGALDTFGESHYLGGAPGLAALQDIALLSGMYGMFTGIIHALALVRSEGTPLTEFVPRLDRWLSSMSGWAHAAAHQIDAGDYASDVPSNLGMQAAGFVNLTRAAQEQGVSPELLEPLGALLRRRAADGHGHEDITGIIELLQKGTPA